LRRRPPGGYPGNWGHKNEENLFAQKRHKKGKKRISPRKIGSQGKFGKLGLRDAKIKKWGNTMGRL